MRNRILLLKVFNETASEPQSLLGKKLRIVMHREWEK